jgi:hypothetical protein
MSESRKLARSWWRTSIAAWKAALAPFMRINLSPRFLEIFDRYFEGPRKVGVPEGEAKTN